MLRQRHLAPIMAVVTLELASCGRPTTPPPKGPTPRVEGARKRRAPAPPKTVDISADVMGSVVFADLDSLVRRGVSFVKPHLPPQAQRLVTPDLIKRKILSTLFRKVPDLIDTLDTARPFAIAVADPKIYRGRGLGPVIMAVPLASVVKFLDILAVTADQNHRKLRGGDHFFGRDRDRGLYVRIVERTAYVASRRGLMQGARAVLEPLLRKAPKLGARLSVEMSRLYGRYKVMIDRGLAKLSRETASMPDPGFLKYIKFVPSMKQLSVQLDLRAAEIRGLLRVATRPGSKMATFLRKLNAGPAWGAGYLPADSVFAMLTRFSPALQKQRLGALVQMAEAALVAVPRGLPIGAMLREMAQRWHAVLGALVDVTTGESAAAIWSGVSGGVGFGTVVRATDADTLRAALRKMTKTLTADASKLVAFVARMSNIRGGVRMSIRENGYRAGNVKGDLVTFAIRYPRLTKKLAARLNLTVKQARERLTRVRRALTLLFGPRTTMALVTMKSASGEHVGLAAFGRDYDARMKQMIAVAQGGKQSRLAGVASGYVGKSPIVALFYTPLALLLEQIMRVADQLTTLPPKLKTFVRAALPPPGKDVPLALWMRTEADATVLRFAASASSDLIGLTVKAGMLFMMRGGSTMSGPMSSPPPPPPPPPAQP